MTKRIDKTYDLVNIKTPIASFRMWRDDTIMEFRSGGIIAPVVWFFYIPLTLFMSWYWHRIAKIEKANSTWDI